MAPIDPVTPITITGEGGFEGLMTLQAMAIHGAPLTHEDRIARQVIANRLSLPPEVYNFLVFGERAPVATAVALKDTAPEQNPSSP